MRIAVRISRVLGPGCVTSSRELYTIHKIVSDTLLQPGSDYLIMRHQMTIKQELPTAHWVWSDLPNHKIGYTSSVHHKMDTVHLKLGSSSSPKQQSCANK